MRVLIALLIAALAASAAPAAAPGTTPADAERLVRTYYADIERGAYRASYLCWGDGGKNSGKTLAEFTRGFARTAHTRAMVGKARDEEGAAGSIYITVPATVTATLKNGAHQRFTGSYVLRRVNDVDGSTASERRWHIYQGKLRQAG